MVEKFEIRNQKSEGLGARSAHVWEKREKSGFRIRISDFEFRISSQ